MYLSSHRVSHQDIPSRPPLLLPTAVSTAALLLPGPAHGQGQPSLPPPGCGPLGPGKLMERGLQAATPGLLPCPWPPQSPAVHHSRTSCGIPMPDPTSEAGPADKALVDACLPEWLRIPPTLMVQGAALTRRLGLSCLAGGALSQAPTRQPTANPKDLGRTSRAGGRLSALRSPGTALTPATLSLPSPRPGVRAQSGACA
mmetsp:Transcript_32129/g.91133  ORF Transcript_32129/g.91133 Transcript_32129/m.91133 type:complete len:200 (-) Transcript_32129:15-614(-)